MGKKIFTILRSNFFCVSQPVIKMTIQLLQQMIQRSKSKFNWISIQVSIHDVSK